MASLSLSCKPSAQTTFSLYKSQSYGFFSLRTQQKQQQQPAKRVNFVPKAQSLNLNSSSSSSSLRLYNPLRLSFGYEGMALMDRKKNGRRSGAVCYAAPLSVRNLQWISTVFSVILMVAKGTGIHKSFLIPLFAIQAPASIISWIKGEYGIWAAFLALIVRLFFSIPGELELPFLALLLVIVAPHQVMRLRGTQEGAIISLVIAGYLAFQHFTRTGSLQKSFDQGSIVATIGIICITAVSLLLLI
ncbi:cold-regulated 413 inner membrane protein 1, chloroplastic-like [Humulus lupulus]|uniref:cold-regulated 413 inner membrane protein 1, chloroplastic-like n=1 Tax=Humulus lupulus TaxID=3486 RepID=UPI002B40FA0F|nr:cold-regulated 413 inner membrane protein 1, chloroplastic-like [Humulus lupulus]